MHGRDPETIQAALTRSMDLFRILMLIKCRTYTPVMQVLNLVKKYGVLGQNVQRKDFYTWLLVHLDVLKDGHVDTWLFSAAPGFIARSDLNVLLDWRPNMAELSLWKRATALPGVMIDQVLAAISITRTFSDGIPRTPEFIQEFPYLVLKMATNHGMTVDDVLEYAREFTTEDQFAGHDVASLKRHADTLNKGRQAKLSLAEVNKKVMAKLASSGCDKCISNTLCDVVNCDNTPQEAIIAAQRERFVCTFEMGHFCKRCRKRWEQVKPAPLVKVDLRTGGNIYAFLMEYHEFTVFDLETQKNVHINATGPFVTSDSVELEDHLCSSSTTIVVKEDSNGNRQGFLRVGRYCDNFRWKIDVGRTVLIKEPWVDSLHRRCFSVQRVDNGKRIEIDCSQKHCSTFGPKCKSTSVKFKSLMEPKNHALADDQPTRVHLQSGRTILEQYVTGGSLTHQRDIRIVIGSLQMRVKRSKV